ncbi:odorant receptor 13a-like, partial [Vespula squamosa]
MSVKYYRSKKKTFVELPVSLLWKQKLYRLVQSENPPYIPTSFGIEPENCNIADANLNKNSDMYCIIHSYKNNNNNNNNHKNNNNNNNEDDYDNSNNNNNNNNPYDAKSYAFGGIYQFFGKTVVLSGYDGTDRLLACTGFHLTGQLAILKCRVKEFLKNNHDTHGFNDSTLNVQLSNSLRTHTVILCKFTLTELERVYRFTFLIYVCILSCTLYGHCYIEHELVRCDLSLRLVGVVDDQFKISLHLHGCIGYVCSTRYNRVGIPYFFQ